MKPIVKPKQRQPENFEMIVDKSNQNVPIKNKKKTQKKLKAKGG